MRREILDQIIDEIIKNDRRSLAPRTLESAWTAWVPELAAKTPLEALTSLGSGWGGCAGHGP